MFLHIYIRGREGHRYFSEYIISTCAPARAIHVLCHINYLYQQELKRQAGREAVTF